MKKDVFIVMMILEGAAALVAAGLLFSDVGAVIYLIALAVYGAVLAPFGICLHKAQDEVKRKIRRNMALVLLIPIGVAAAVVAVVVIALMCYFG